MFDEIEEDEYYWLISFKYISLLFYTIFISIFSNILSIISLIYIDSKKLTTWLILECIYLIVFDDEKKNLTEKLLDN